MHFLPCQVTPHLPQKYILCEVTLTPSPKYYICIILFWTYDMYNTLPNNDVVSPPLVHMVCLLSVTKSKL